MRFAAGFGILSLIASAMIGEANAISFDKLGATASEAQSIFGQGPVSVTSSAVGGSAILGGNRYMQVNVTGGTYIFCAANLGNLSHSQNAGTKGSSFLVWDGNPAPSVQPTGLGGLDLTADGATGFRVLVSDFDYPNSQPLKLTFTVYDASDPTGAAKVSVGTIVLDSVVDSQTTPPLERLLPFANLVKSDTASGPADLKNVGAITLLLDGSLSASYDVELRAIGTNGRCDHVPVNRLVVDACGVCNGDNSTCSDCEGVPNGTGVAGTQCSTGKLGVCGDGTYSGKFPRCECVQDKPSSDEICDKVDNDCDGEIDEGAPTVGPLADECGVCGGDGTSCLNCNSIDMSSILNALDGGAKQQETIVQKSVALLRTLPQGRKEARFISKTLQAAHTLQLRNWVLSWSVPQISTTCDRLTSLCTTTSNLPVLTEYRDNNTTLRDFALKVLNKIKAAKRGKLSVREKALIAAANKQYNDNLSLSKTVPDTHFVCATKV